MIDCKYKMNKIKYNDKRNQEYNDINLEHNSHKPRLNYTVNLLSEWTSFGYSYTEWIETQPLIRDPPIIPA